MTHTPTPFNLPLAVGYGDGSGAEEGCFIVVDADGQSVFWSQPDTSLASQGGARTWEKAEYIIRAVNSHASLIEALRSARNGLSSFDEFGHIQNVGVFISRIDAALALAGES